MGQGNGDRVRRVVRLGDRLHMKQHLHHLLNLLLLGPAPAHDGLFDLHGRIFVKLIRILGAGGDAHAPGRAHVQRGGHVFGEKQLLKGDLLRLKALEQRPHVLADLLQPLREALIGRGQDATVLDQALPSGLRVDHAPAQRGQTGVDA